MKTKNSFIDTQAFMQQGLRFDNQLLSKLSQLGGEGKLNLIISDVVFKEVESKILDKVQHLEIAKSELKKAISMLGDDIPSELSCLNTYDAEALRRLGVDRWKRYVEDSKIEVLDSNSICNKELLDLYFEGEFPFSVGKKKDEFPDAISVLSLKSWAEKNRAHSYFVSGDSDIMNACNGFENFTSLEKLGDLIDLYNRSEVKLTKELHSNIEEQLEWIKEEISNAFLECEFTFSDNWESEVEDVKIIFIEIYDQDVIDIVDNQCLISVQVRIECTAHVSGPDYESSPWDNEDKEYFYIERFSSELEFEDFYEVSLNVEIEEEPVEITEVKEVLFDGNKKIGLWIDDGFPYK